MDRSEQEPQIPSALMSSLEDMSAEILDLQELILTLAQVADELPLVLDSSPCTDPVQ